MGYRVFLSHNVNREDYSLVVYIANLLWQQGIEVFVPEWHPRYHTGKLPVDQQTAAQISASDFVVAIVTSATSRPIYMHQELGYALGKEKHVVALVEKGVNPEGFLYNLPRLDFSRFEFEDAAKVIVDYIYDKRQVKERREKTVLGLILGGLFLWWLGQQGRQRADEGP